jgi:hypothetical protein
MHECFANPERNDGFGADSSPSRDVLVGALSALLRRSLFARQWSALDPLLPFKVGPMNGREARQSGLRLKAYIAPRGGRPSNKPRIRRFDPSRPMRGDSGVA